jgi:hypothetical protein
VYAPARRGGAAEVPPGLRECLYVGYAPVRRVTLLIKLVWIRPMLSRSRAALRITQLCLLALAAAVVCGQADASKAVLEKFTCPIGGEKFTATVVHSGYLRGRRLDLRPVGLIVSPFPMPVCRSNGFVMYKDDFPTEEIAKLTLIVQSQAYQDLRKKHHSHYLGASLRERMGAPDFELAHMYVKASWQAEGEWSPGRTGDEEASRKRRALADEYRLLSQRKLDSFMTQTETRSPQWWSAAVVAAELERLLGRFAAVETRLAGLLADAATATAGQRAAMAQIRTHASNKNAKPEVFLPSPAEP